MRKIFKNKKERTEERKRRDCYICEGSHTHVFSIGWEHPQATNLMRHSLRRTHLYGNPTNNILTGLLCWVIPFFLSVCMMHNIGW